MSADAGPVEIKIFILHRLDLDPAREDRNVTEAAGSLYQACEVSPHAACPGDPDDVAGEQWDAIRWTPEPPRRAAFRAWSFSDTEKWREKSEPDQDEDLALLVKGSEETKERGTDGSNVNSLVLWGCTVTPDEWTKH